MTANNSSYYQTPTSVDTTVYGKLITQFKPITDAALSDPTLLWVVGDAQGTLYKPTIRQMQTVIAGIVPTQKTYDLQTVLDTGSILNKNNVIQIGATLQTWMGPSKAVRMTEGDMSIASNDFSKWLHLYTTGITIGEGNSPNDVEKTILVGNYLQLIGTDSRLDVNSLYTKLVFDSLNNQGTNGQLLTSTGSGLKWVDQSTIVTPPVTPPPPQGFQSVLDTNSNLTKSNTVNLNNNGLTYDLKGSSGLISIIDTTATGRMVVFTEDGMAVSAPSLPTIIITAQGIKDRNNSYGGTTQVLCGTGGSGVEWRTPDAPVIPTYTTPTLDQVAQQGNTTTKKINALNYDATASLIMTQNGVRFMYNDTNALAIGINSLINNTGNQATAVGYNTMPNNTGNWNTAIGYAALLNQTTGVENTGVGNGALHQNTGGSYNTGVGANTNYQNIVGSQNTAVGYYALLNNTGSDNSAIGVSASRYNTIGGANVGIGRESNWTNTTGNNNTAVGSYALHNYTGSNNTAIGYNAASNLSTGNSNLAIGSGVSLPSNTGDNQMNINNIFYSNDGTKVGVFQLNPVYTFDVTGTGRFTGKLTIGAYTLPNTDGGTGQVLSSNGAGVVGWSTVASGYVLPIASSTVLGGVKVGPNSGISVDGTGLVSSPIATTSVLGHVKIGTGLAIDASGLLTSTGLMTETDAIALSKTVTVNGNTQPLSSNPTFTIPPYVLPVASISVLGGIKVGNNLTIDGSGILSANSSYILPIASPSILGGIKVGNNLSIDVNGVLSGNAVPYNLPIASANILGGIKVGNNLVIDGSGVLSSVAVGVSTIAVNVDGGGSVLTLGQKGYIQIPYNATITGWTIISREASNIQFDVWKRAAIKPTVANSITASTKPAITTSVDYATSTTLTGWSTTIAAGDIIGWNLDSVATSTWAILELTILRT